MLHKSEPSVAWAGDASSVATMIDLIIDPSLKSAIGKFANQPP
jgi:hypothetical protein